MVRPWVKPQEVRDYTEIPEVRSRSDERLSVDISRAEQYVITYTHNSFKDEVTIPQAVRTAVLLLAETYGNNAVKSAKSVKSETFDDYSYTSEFTQIGVDSLDLAALLDEFVVPTTKNRIGMKLRRL